MLFWLVDEWMLGYFGRLMLRCSVWLLQSSDWLLGCCLDVLGGCYIVARMFRLFAWWLVRMFQLVGQMLWCFGWLLLQIVASFFMVVARLFDVLVVIRVFWVIVRFLLGCSASCQMVVRVFYLFFRLLLGCSGQLLGCCGWLLGGHQDVLGVCQLFIRVFWLVSLWMFVCLGVLSDFCQGV